MMDVEDMVAAAFAGRLKSASKDDIKTRLLAGLTLSVMNVAIISWFRGEFQDLSPRQGKCSPISRAYLVTRQAQPNPENIS